MNVLWIILYMFSVLLHQEAAENVGALIENPFEKFGDDKTNFVVLQVHRLGFSNRLRVIADMAVIAAQTNRILLISWQASVECNITFTEVFEEVRTSRVRILPFELPINKGAMVISSLATQYGYSFADLLHEDFLMSWSKVGDPSIRVVFSNYNGVVSLDGTPCELQTQLRSRFLASLTPAAGLRHHVQRIMDGQFSTSLMVGVHFRVQDDDFDWDVVPPLDGAGDAQPFGYGSGVEAFERIMQTIQMHFAQKTRSVYGIDGQTSASLKDSRQKLDISQQSTNTVKFFLASNSETAKDYFISRFPNLFVVSSVESAKYEVTHSRSSTEGMRLAVIDWLLLSKSAILIHTFGSSFAVEAAQVHQRPLISVWGAGYLYAGDVKQQFCSKAHFAKSYATYGVETYMYAEGTTDRRSVEASQIEYLPCDVLREWGLSGLHCLSAQ